MRPTVGSYHCFGCGEGGDVISFVQKVEHLTFTESVERLAAKLGIELRYEEGGGPARAADAGKRSRLIEAHRVAADFYAELLLDTGSPTPGPAATSCASAASTGRPPSGSASASPRRAGTR